MPDDATVDHRPDQPDPLATVAQGGSQTGGRSFEVRCPHCRSSISVPAEASLANISCRTCGSQFDMVNEAVATWAAPAFTSLGRFELVDKLGAGSFGTVWKARDRELDRTVAIKTPRQGAMSAAETEKFFREARAAAQLRHPNIVSVHEVGRDGQSVYIVSDFVRGVTLGDWLTGQRLTSRESAELCATIADALEHAHEQGVVHRDLKPGNIMIDGDGEPHLMDFGLARRETGEVTMTADGHVLGTPAYMSPEQAAGESHTADRRSDVYSLGVILFELLTSELPFRGNSRMLIHQVINEEAPSPRKFNGAVPRDLETIALKCMEKKPEKRFQTAAELAAELRRHLNGEPILSRPISRIAKTWRWAKRKPVVAGLTAAVGALLCVVGAAGPVIAIREAALRETAERGEQEAISLRDAAEQSKKRALAKELEAQTRAKSETQARQQAEQAQRSAEASQQELSAAQEASERTVYARTISLAQQEWQSANISQCEDLLDGTRSDLRGWEWGYLKHLCRSEQITLRGLRGPVNWVSLHEDGRHVACNAASDQVMMVWDRQSGQIVARYSMTGFGFNRRGTRFAGYSLAPEARAMRGVSELLGGGSPLEIYDVLSGAQLSGGIPSHRGGTTWAEFNADGTKLATIGRDGAVRVWDATNGSEIVKIDEPDEQAWHFVSISPDGKRVAWRRSGGFIVVYDVASGELLREIHDPINGVSRPWLAFNFDGTSLAATSRDQVAIWDVESGQKRRMLHGHRGLVMDLYWSPQGEFLATCGYDGTARLWDVGSGRELLCLRGHKAGGSYGVFCVAFNEAGDALVTGGADATVKVWDAKANDPLPDEFDAPAARDESATSYVWQLTPDLRQDVDWIYGHRAYAYDLDFTPDGREVVTCSKDGGVHVTDVATGLLVRDFEEHGESVAAVCVSPDGSLIASGSGGIDDAEQGTILIWLRATGEVRQTLKGHDYPISRLRFTPDGQKLISSSGSQTRPDLGELIVWDAAAGKLLRKLDGIDAAVTGLDVSSDGQFVAACTYNGRIQLWNVETGEHIRDLGQTGEVFGALAFSPDGKTIAAGGRQWSITLFDAETGSAIWKRFEHSGALYDVSFAGPNRLLSASIDGSARMWDVESGECLLAFRDSASDLYRPRMSPDGRTLACCGAEPRLSLRRLPPPSQGRASEWQLLVRDDFESGGLDSNWEVVNGDWTIENGAARGVFAPELENNQYYAATLGAKIPMPDRVDVTMEMWAPQEIGYEIKLNNDQTRQSLIALLIGKLGLDFNRGERGYSIVTQLGAGNWQEASSRRGEFEVGRKYKIRAVRDAGRWRMFVDDQLMLESDAAEDLSLPELRLQGSQGKAGDVVYLDNVEIRTPVKTGVREGEWPVILADDFEREEIGPDWREANGSWSIENGAARGTFDHENGDENALIFAATLEPATLMPTAVEVSYDCWSPSAIVVETVLRDPQWTSGLCAAHIGKTGAWSNRGERGFSIIVLAGANNFQEVARRRFEFVFESERRYRIRTVRDQGRLRMFVDDSLVLEAEAPDDLFAPLLHIHGIHGKQDDLIYVDNVQVRSPVSAALADIVKSRPPEQAAELILRRSTHSAAGVAEAIEVLTATPDAKSAAAIDQLRLGELIALGNAPDKAVQAIRQAMAQGGGLPFYFKSLGVALYKNGEKEAAKEQFEKSLGQTSLEDASEDQWAAAYYLDRVTEEQFVDRLSQSKSVTEAFAWYFIGQRKEADGKRDEARAAFQKAVDAAHEHGVKAHFVLRAEFCLNRLL